MLSIIKLIIAYAIPALVGFGLLTLIDRQAVLTRARKVVASFLIGQGLLTLQIFTIGVLGLAVSLKSILIILLFDFVALGMAIWFKRRAIKFIPEKLDLQKTRAPKIVFIIIILVLLSRVFLSFWQVTSTPTFDFDAWNNWNLRAKVIYIEQKIPLDSSDEVYLGGGIVSYPLHDSLWKVWLAEVSGEWQEGMINLSSVANYILLISLFYFFLPQKLNNSVKLLGVLMLSGMPFVFLHSWVPYPDLLFGAILFLVAVNLYYYLLTKQSLYLYLSALSLGFLIWTKNEGFVVVLPVLLLVLLYLNLIKKISWKKSIKYILVAFISSAPWLIFRFSHQLDLLSGDSSSFALVYNSGLIGEWFRAIFLRSNFIFLFLLVWILLLSQARRIFHDLSLRFLSLVFSLLFLFYNAIIVFTDRAQDLGALVRVNLHLAPLALFIVILLVVKMFHPPSP